MRQLCLGTQFDSRPKISTIVTGLVLATLSLSALPASGQDYPDRPIRVIVPYPPGGPTDTLARALGEGFRERTKHGFVIENRPGANTGLGGLACKQSTPDGYTLCFLASTTVSLNPHLYQNLRYGPQDFAPVSNVATTRAIFLVNKGIPAANLKEFVEYTKKNPEKMNYGSFGVGGETHLMVEWLKSKTGIVMTHVPFTGFAPAIQAFDRGDIQVMVPIAVPPILDRMEKKQATGMFILGDNRADNVPGLPSVQDLGLPAIGFNTWFGMLAPAGTPQDRIDKASAVIREVVAQKEFVAKYMSNSGFVPAGSTPAEFKAFLDRDYIKAGELVKLSGVKLTAE
jgi:tripartite-type tricarboxylate transporter receptor subunit TctC